MQIKRSLLVLTLVGALAGCESMNSFIDSVMAPTGTSNTAGSSNLPSNIPSAPPPNMPTPTSQPAASTPRTASSLVIYVGSNQTEPGYSLVQQKGQSIYVDPRQTLLHRDLSNALAVMDESNRAFVNLVFSASGQDKLAQLTRNNTGRSLVVTMSNELISIINIAAPVTNGTLYVPMANAQDAQTFERRILDGE